MSRKLRRGRLTLFGLIVVALLPVVRAEAAQVSMSIRVVVRAFPGEAVPNRAEVAVAVAGMPETDERYVLQEVAGTLRAVVPAAASGWIVNVEAPGWWAPTVRVVGGNETVLVTLVPEGSIQFELEGDDVAVDTLDSSNVKVFGRLWTRGERLDRGVFGGPCEIGEGRESRGVPVLCPFALGETADFYVTLGPFLPWARPAVTVGRNSDFGVVTPVRGATVSGSLQGGGDGEGPFLLALAPRRGEMPATAWTDERGAFVFEGIGLGTHELYLERSRLDRWTARVDSLSDWVDMGVVVSAAANRFTLDLVATPALLSLEGLAVSAYRIVERDDSSPAGLFGARHLGEPFFDGSSLFRWSGLPAGPYRVFVEGDWGNRWFTEVVNFGSSGRGAVEVDVVRVRGQVRRGSQPLENVLIWFGGLHGGQRIVIPTGHDGRFEGFLPRRLGLAEEWGAWGVKVTAVPPCNPCEGDWTGGSWAGFDPRTSMSDAGVFDVVEGVDGAARLDINLPDGRIAGNVVRMVEEAGGRAVVPGARVRLVTEGVKKREWSAVTSETGSFEFLGVPEASVEITATAGVGDQVLRSDPRFFRLAEGDEVQDVDVVLRRQRPLRFLLRSGGSAVPGAIAVVRYNDRSRGQVNTRRTTNNEGSVTFWLPFSTEPVDLIVHAEGLGSNGWRFPAPPTEEVELNLFEARGELVLPRGRESFIVNAFGVEMTLVSLRANGQTRDVEGGRLIRNLAPGRYSYCVERGECTGVQVIAGVINNVTD